MAVRQSETPSWSLCHTQQGNVEMLSQVAMHNLQQGFECVMRIKMGPFVPAVSASQALLGCKLSVFDNNRADIARAELDISYPQLH